MEFERVDLNKNLDLCLAFRRDTHILSYGNDTTFNSDECTNWFESLKRDNPDGFLHVTVNHKIIGQLEFKSAIQKENDLTGYINLIYLLPEYRNRGYGAILENHMLSIFRSDRCTAAYLRYLPANKVAGNFYKKQGWTSVGTPNERGQLMIRTLI